MKLKFEASGFQYMIDSIMEFQNEEQGEFFKESLYYFYPQIDREKMNSLNKASKEEYIKSVFEGIYQSNEMIFKDKVRLYQEHWDDNEETIVKTFEEIFDMDLSNSFNSMKSFISLNPICPRYLDTNTFDIFYLNSEKGALGMSLHEITHFIWFKKWNEHFHDKWEEYDTPHLKWVFSEMVVESILSDEKLKALNPYAGNSVYEYFYKIKIKGVPILKILDKLYRTNSIIDFMENGYELCQQNEELIRSFMY